MYVVKAVTEKMGKFDSKEFAKTLHGMTILAAKEPGILMDVTYDENGDIDRQGFLVEIVNGKQVISKVLPKLGK
jgi:branched-chain amino acid transport system substrate-binding protein